MTKWNIHSTIFDDKEQNERVLIVIHEILTEIHKLIPDGPPLGFREIKLLNDPVAGPTMYWPKEGSAYKIALNISDVNHNQIAFQFSQELCRIYCSPKITNWFVQLLSHILALYMLDFLGTKWEKNPPSVDLTNYWYNFDSYKSNLLGAAFSKVDMVRYQVANEWVEQQIEKIRREGKINRGKILIVAYELLPFFKENPELWNMLPIVEKCTQTDALESSTDRFSEPDFDKLLQCLPENLSPVVLKFFKKLGLKLPV